MEFDFYKKGNSGPKGISSLSWSSQGTWLESLAQPRDGWQVLFYYKSLEMAHKLLAHSCCFSSPECGALLVPHVTNLHSKALLSVVAFLSPDTTLCLSHIVLSLLQKSRCLGH